MYTMESERFISREDSTYPNLEGDRGPWIF